MDCMLARVVVRLLMNEIWMDRWIVDRWIDGEGR